MKQLKEKLSNETENIKQNILNAIDEVKLIKNNKLPKKTLAELIKEKK